MRRSYTHDFSYRLRKSKRFKRRCRRCIYFEFDSYYKCVKRLESPWLAEIRSWCKDFSDVVQLSLF